LPVGQFSYLAAALSASGMEVMAWVEPWAPVGSKPGTGPPPEFKTKKWKNERNVRTVKFFFNSSILKILGL
jgi:hypothetical protein